LTAIPVKHFNSGCRPEAVVDILPPEADSTVQSMAAELQLCHGVLRSWGEIIRGSVVSRWIWSWGWYFLVLQRASEKSFGPKTSTPHAGLVDKHKLSMKNMAREFYLFFPIYIIYIYILYMIYMVPKGKLT
jgi:hypothetical protein